jgi:hypothetical protein
MSNERMVVSLLVVVQAFLAGRGFMMGKPDLIDAHGMVGNVLFLLGIELVVIASIGFRKGVLDMTDLALSAVMGLLIVGQIGLGYAGRDNTTAASLHWPNGVLITVVTALLAGRSLPRRGAAV